MLLLGIISPRLSIISPIETYCFSSVLIEFSKVMTSRGGESKSWLAALLIGDFTHMLLVLPLHIVNCVENEENSLKAKWL